MKKPMVFTITVENLDEDQGMSYSQIERLQSFLNGIDEEDIVGALEGSGMQTGNIEYNMRKQKIIMPKPEKALALSFNMKRNNEVNNEI